MAKRSNRHGDIVSETQQNSRWLFGYRKNVFWSDMSPAEWSRYWRDQPVRTRLELIVSLLILIPLAISGLIIIFHYGISMLSLLVGGIFVLPLLYYYLYYRRAVRKSLETSKRK